jgi:phosphotransferase system HPr-like phosphotransfer protein
MVLAFTQPLTEISTRNLPGVKARPALNLTATCELYRHAVLVYRNTDERAALHRQCAN